MFKKIWLLLKRCPFVMSFKNRWSMIYIVCPTNDVMGVTIVIMTSCFQSGVIIMSFCQDNQRNNWLFPSCYGYISKLTYHL